VLALRTNFSAREFTMAKEPEINSDELPPKKRGNILTRKLPIGPAELATALASSVGLSAGLTLADAKFQDREAKGTLDTVAVVQKAEKDSGENAPKTLAALENERIRATSEAIQNRTAEGWLEGVAVAGGIGATAAASRIGRNKKRPGEKTDQSKDSGKLM
jgi:hypothetical protein